jgi:hypothetical protein
MSFVKSDEYNLSQLEGLTRSQKAKTLELATHQLQIRHSDGNIEKKEYLNHFLRILKERSRLGKIEYQPIEKPIMPREGHASTKATLSYTNDNEFSTRIKVSYHDIYDNESGYISGAYIDFFDTSINYKKDKLTLEEMNFLNIRSYAIQNSIFKPISWEVSVGGKRIFDNELNAYLKGGAGITLGNESFFTYAMLTPTLYYREDTKESISANLGVIYNPTTNFKLGLLGTHEWFRDNAEIKTIESFMTFSIFRDSAINLNYKYQELDKLKEEDITLSWFIYF